MSRCRMQSHERMTSAVSQALASMPRVWHVEVWLETTLAEAHRQTGQPRAGFEEANGKDRASARWGPRGRAARAAATGCTPQAPAPSACQDARSLRLEPHPLIRLESC